MSSYDKAQALINRGPSRPTLYSINIPVLSDSDSKFAKIFCTSISIPGVSHEVVSTLGQESMGVMRDTPTSVRYGGNITINVIENSDFDMYKAFKGLFDRTASNANPIRGRTQRMKFYDDYIFNFQVDKLEYPSDKVGKLDNDFDDFDSPYRVVQRFNFEDCYVTSLGSIGLSSEASNQLLTFQVKFNYELYYTENG